LFTQCAKEISQIKMTFFKINKKINYLLTEQNTEKFSMKVSIKIIILKINIQNVFTFEMSDPPQS
jgi:hypothetical protein